ncbi:MAG: DUF4384 domain-containing protein [Pyrinomonadaceae bacterium]|nr:DUF4384 domain-containing protein [Pyrinomonadaceae bacterium]
MRSKFFSFIIMFAFVANLLPPATPAQDLITSANARNTFVSSRPDGLGTKQRSGGDGGNRGNSNRAGGGGTQNRRSSGNTSSGRNTVASRSNPPRRSATTRPPQNTPAPPTAASARMNSGVTTSSSAATNSFVPTSIGLGYTLFMRDASGNPKRVDPSTNFRAGDHIRINLESNIDGYLYIFHTENGNNPQMLFPDTRLNNANNLVTAHVPYEAPSSAQANEEERWFVFDNKPAVERLYIVVTREPLPSVPTETALINYCADKPQPCTWRPTDQVWAKVKTQSADSRVVVNRSKETDGQTQTTDEREAVTRGTTLTQSAPEPSIVRMNASSQTNLLVTMIDLIHR